MVSIDIVKLVECSMTGDSHYLECPLPLSCGHHVCKKCLPPNKNYQFRCIKCSCINQFDLNTCQESDIVAFHLQHYLPNLSKLINEKIEAEIEISDDPVNSLKNFYDTKIETIRDDIDIRTESLKAELDNLRDFHHQQLDDLKSKINTKIELILQENNDDEKKVSPLSVKKHKTASNFEELYKNQKALLDIRNKNNFYHLKSIYIDFYFNKTSFSLINIGELNYFDMSEIDSAILDLNGLTNLYHICAFKKPKKLCLLYRASVDGFDAARFHEKCDYTPNTLTVVKSNNGFIFGGFTTQMWTNLNSLSSIDNEAFLFSLVNAENCPEKMIVKPDSKAVENDSSHGPKFGSGPDLFICSDAHNSSNSCSVLDKSYSCKSNEPNKFFDGETEFMLSEIEVFVLANAYDFVDGESSILNYLEMYRLYNLCGFENMKNWKLLYRASSDGFEASKFHENCDDIANTLTIVKSTNNFIFGGFTSQTWTNQASIYKTDEKAFLFGFRNPSNKTAKLPIKPNCYAIYCDPNSGPNFGDLVISNCSNTNDSSLSIGSNYLNSYSSSYQLFADRNSFRISEIEVFSLGSF